MQLKGIRVVEIGQAFAGPFASEILAHLGADVIKVERPNGGDEARRWGPPFWGGDAAVFHAINSNKRSVALDLKAPQDVATCKALLAEADILVHNLRPGALQRLGLGADDLAQEFPRLIYAEISAYGATGPLKDLPGYEILGQAFGGVMSITGEAEGGPVRCGPSVCDFGSGMWLAIGVLAALQERHRTGKGGLVQTSLFETALSWTAVAASSYLASGNEPGRNGASHHLIAPYGLFVTKTGPLMLACASDALFDRLADALGHSIWKSDERFHNNPARVRHKTLIEGMIGEIIGRKPQDHWFKVLGQAGVPCAPVNTISEALTHPQTEALNMLQSTPEATDILTLGLPLSFDGARPSVLYGAPALGKSKPAWTV